MPPDIRTAHEEGVFQILEDAATDGNESSAIRQPGSQTKTATPITVAAESSGAKSAKQSAKVIDAADGEEATMAFGACERGAKQSASVTHATVDADAVGTGAGGDELDLVWELARKSRRARSRDKRVVIVGNGKDALS